MSLRHRFDAPRWRRRNVLLSEVKLVGSSTTVFDTQGRPYVNASSLLTNIQVSFPIGFRIALRVVSIKHTAKSWACVNLSAHVRCSIHIKDLVTSFAAVHRSLLINDLSPPSRIPLWSQREIFFFFRSKPIQLSVVNRKRLAQVCHHIRM